MSNNTSDVLETCLLIDGGGYNTKNEDRNVRVVNPSLKSKNHALKAPNSYEKFIVLCMFFFFFCIDRM
jgi:hypothetical protein